MIFFELYSFGVLVIKNLNLDLDLNPGPGSGFVFTKAWIRIRIPKHYILHCARLVCHCSPVKNRVYPEA
jgi:hypothetical protein